MGRKEEDQKLNRRKLNRTEKCFREVIRDFFRRKRKASITIYHLERIC